MNVTYNGRTYRVIYTAEGDLWARDVINNPPRPKANSVNAALTAVSLDDWPAYITAKRKGESWQITQSGPTKS